jgi:quaternary ammonium compound-resistance protein SugE
VGKSGFSLAIGQARKALIGSLSAIWIGIGTVGTAALGIVLLGESPNPLRLGCIALIVIGTIGLKSVSPE